jgi:Tol biopolymer transport system component
MSDMRRLREAVRAATGLALGVLLVATPAHAGEEATTTRVDVGVEGPADEPSSSPSISGDGRFVAFVSDASNLAEGDSDGDNDAFVRDLESDTTRLVSDSSGYVYPDIAISADGRYVAFTANDSDILVKDLVTGETELVTVGVNGVDAYSYGWSASISADGRYVTFVSDAWNLVPGDTNRIEDVFVRDLEAGVTRRLSVGWTGAEANGESLAPSISANGRFVAFQSVASNLIRRDANRHHDVFVHNLETRRTRRISLGFNGSEANGNSRDPSISANGRRVAFASRATNLVRGDTNSEVDVFVRNRRTGRTRRASIGSNGTQSNADSRDPSISDSGRFVAFSSWAANLVIRDTNDREDVFVRNLGAGETQLVSLGTDGAQQSRSSSHPAISADGRHVAFVSRRAYRSGDIYRRGPLR